MFQELNYTELEGIDGGSWKSYVFNLVGVVSVYIQIDILTSDLRRTPYAA